MEARLTKRRLLGEFLLKQQVPCALEAFLLERGCSRSLFNGSFVQRSSSRMRKKGVIQSSKLLRAIQHQIGFSNGSIMNIGVEVKELGNAVLPRVLAPAIVKLLQNKMGFPVLVAPQFTSHAMKVVTRKKTRIHKTRMRLESEIQESIQENEHLSSSSCRAGLVAKTTEDSVISASLQEILIHYFKHKPGYSKFPVPNQVASCDYLNSKKGEQQTKRLLYGEIV